MKKIKSFILEKLIINKNIKIEKGMSPEMQSIWDHFEMDKLYEPDSGRLQKEPFLTEEEGNEMIKKIEDFLSKNKWDVTKFKYFIQQGYKFKDNKIAKDFKKNNMSVMNRNSFISDAEDKETIFKKGSLRFDASASEKLLGMYGPYGGSKVVEFNE